MVHILQLGVPASQTPAYQNRKGWLSQNVFAVCNFNLEFTYILAGWERSAHDSCVLKNAIANGGMYVPAGKYLLANAGYYNSNFSLTSIILWYLVQFEKASSNWVKIWK